MIEILFNLLRTQDKTWGAALFLIIVDFLEESISDFFKKEKKGKKNENLIPALPPVAEQELEKAKKPFSIMKMFFLGTTAIVVVPLSTSFIVGFAFRGVFIPQNQTVTVKCGNRTVEVPNGSTVKCSGMEIVTPK
jgi:hypothetical protein